MHPLLILLQVIALLGALIIARVAFMRANEAFERANHAGESTQFTQQVVALRDLCIYADDSASRTLAREQLIELAKFAADSTNPLLANSNVARLIHTTSMAVADWTIKVDSEKQAVEFSEEMISYGLKISERADSIGINFIPFEIRLPTSN